MDNRIYYKVLNNINYISLLKLFLKKTFPNMRITGDIQNVTENVKYQIKDLHEQFIYLQSNRTDQLLSNLILQQILLNVHYLGCTMRKRVFRYMRTARAQISQRIRSV